MTNFSRKCEFICGSLDKAIKASDYAVQYQLCLVLLCQIVVEHKRLLAIADSMSADGRRLNHFETQYTNPQHYYRSRSGWGRSSSRGDWIGSDASILRPCAVTGQHVISGVRDLIQTQIVYNAELMVLQQYCDALKGYRKTLLNHRPLNVGQRTIQNVLLASVADRNPTSKIRIDDNPVCNTVCGHFTSVVNPETITTIARQLSNKKDKRIGRLSYNEGIATVKQHTETKSKVRPNTGDRLGLEFPSTRKRSYSLYQYVSNSPRYKARLSWIRGLQNVSQAISILRYVDGWKRDYAATNQMAYSTALNGSPYVKTIVTSRAVLVGHCEYLETSVPVYSAECICWENSQTQRQTAYWIGRTGSTIVDKRLKGIEWYHHSDRVIDRTGALQSLQGRIQRMTGETQSLKQRRREIASYARKLVWIDSINMLDSKNAGNCLPGTRQFAAELKLQCPAEWSDFEIDSRSVLRKWKESGYNANRLLLPAIDAAVNRVRRHMSETMLQCVAYGYVPAIVK